MKIVTEKHTVPPPPNNNNNNNNNDKSNNKKIINSKIDVNTHTTTTTTTFKRKEQESNNDKKNRIDEDLEAIRKSTRRRFDKQIWTPTKEVPTQAPSIIIPHQTGGITQTITPVRSAPSYTKSRITKPSTHDNNKNESKNKNNNDKNNEWE